MFYTVYEKNFDQFFLDTILFGNNEVVLRLENNKRSTITRWLDSPPVTNFSLERAITVLKKFNHEFQDLHSADRKTLYRSFKIPKHSGGYRPIDAPNDRLMTALRTLASILKGEFGALYHTAAYAYVEGRCPVDAVKKHQSFDSKWFLKTDFSNFFGSITPEFVEKMLGLIYPFNIMMDSEEGKSELTKAMDLCFLNGGLPQGTPISPMLTNLVMIPIDHFLNSVLSPRAFVYTRYADDITVSAVEKFDPNLVTNAIKEALKKYDAPFHLNTKKTKFVSKAGSNWNLGVMLNKDNNITVGHLKKKYFKAALCSFITDKKNGVNWDPEDVMELAGTLSYYRSVEKEYFDYVIKHYNQKFHVNTMALLTQAVSAM